MDLEKIEKLIRLMQQHGLSELQVKSGELDFKARRGERPLGPIVAMPAGSVTVPTSTQPATPLSAEDALDAERATAHEKSGPGAGALPEGYKEILSPIVGTLYRKPSPDSPAYVQVGDEVQPDTVVCIVEAMKVMNEIKAEISGVIRKALVEDASPIEFGQPLFWVEPR